MPALAPQHLSAVGEIVEGAGYRLELLPELNTRDVEAGLRFCSNDLCYPLIAVAGQVIRALRGYTGDEPATVVLPQTCCGCRATELEQVVRRQLKNVNQNSTIEVIGIPSRNELFTMPAWLATRIYDALVAADDGCRAGAGSRVGAQATPDCSVPRVGVIGTAALLYTPQLNYDLLARIKAEGCEPCTPPFVELLTTNAPLERFVERFVEQGILDIICIQSFGCMNGHIHGRGAAKRLRKRHPGLSISFIDYDSGASEINQDNRLRLALTIAHERAARREFFASARQQ
jgi:predicted nucleotide-binding protein (sugar kinase/HSP70/actin superfamily)